MVEFETDYSLMSFHIGKYSFCVPVNEVIEVVYSPKITRIIATPDYVVGTFQTRGRLAAAINLGMKLSINSEHSDQSCFIISQLPAGNTVAFEVDSVGDVFDGNTLEWHVPINEINSRLFDKITTLDSRPMLHSSLNLLFHFDAQINMNEVEASEQEKNSTETAFVKDSKIPDEKFETESNSNDIEKIVASPTEIKNRETTNKNSSVISFQDYRKQHSNQTYENNFLLTAKLPVPVPDDIELSPKKHTLLLEDKRYKLVDTTHNFSDAPYNKTSNIVKATPPITIQEPSQQTTAKLLQKPHYKLATLLNRNNPWQYRSATNKLKIITIDSTPTDPSANDSLFYRTPKNLTNSEIKLLEKPNFQFDQLNSVFSSSQKKWIRKTLTEEAPAKETSISPQENENSESTMLLPSLPKANHQKEKKLNKCASKRYRLSKTIHNNNVIQLPLLEEQLSINEVEEEVIERIHEHKLFPGVEEYIQQHPEDFQEELWEIEIPTFNKPKNHYNNRRQKMIGTGIAATTVAIVASMGITAYQKNSIEEFNDSETVLTRHENSTEHQQRTQLSDVEKTSDKHEKDSVKKTVTSKIIAVNITANNKDKNSLQEKALNSLDKKTSTTQPKIDIEKILPAAIQIHQVTPGDTLWDISQNYLNDPFLYPTLAKFNGIENPDLIYPGDTIQIPQQIQKNI